MIYNEKMKMEDEFKRHYEAKLASEGKDKKESESKRRRSTFQVKFKLIKLFIQKKPITNTTKSAINQGGLNGNIVNNSLFAGSNNLSVNFIRKSVVRKESFIQVQKRNNCNFPVINRADNKK